MAEVWFYMYIHSAARAPRELTVEPAGGFCACALAWALKSQLLVRLCCMRMLCIIVLLAGSLWLSSALVLASVNTITSACDGGPVLYVCPQLAS